MIRWGPEHLVAEWKKECEGVVEVTHELPVTKPSLLVSA